MSNIDNPYFEGMNNQIHPPELQLNKANVSDIEVPFLDLHISFSNGFMAVSILRLVLWDQQKYSEKSENIIGLDSYILNSFSYLSPI